MGTVEVTVLSARLTEAGAKLAQGSLVVEVETPAGLRSTPPTASGPTPAWNAVLHVSVEASETLHVRLKASALLLSGGVVGRCQILVRDFLAHPAATARSYDLVYGHSYVVGQLLLALRLPADGAGVATSPLASLSPTSIFAGAANGSHSTAGSPHASPTASGRESPVAGTRRREALTTPQLRTMLRVLQGTTERLAALGASLQFCVKVDGVVRCSGPAAVSGTDIVWNEDIPVAAGPDDVLEFSLRDADRPQLILGRSQNTLRKITDGNEPGCVEFHVSFLDLSRRPVGVVKATLIQTSATPLSTPRLTSALRVISPATVPTTPSPAPVQASTPAPAPAPAPAPSDSSETVGSAAGSVAGSVPEAAATPVAEAAVSIPPMPTPAGSAAPEAERPQLTLTVVRGDGFAFGALLQVRLRLGRSLAATTVQPVRSRCVWQETFRLVAEGGQDVLEVQVYDGADGHSVVGRGRVPVHELLAMARGQEDLELVIRDPVGGLVGIVLLEISSPQSVTRQMPASSGTHYVPRPLPMPTTPSRRLSVDTNRASRPAPRSPSSSLAPLPPATVTVSVPRHQRPTSAPVGSLPARRPPPPTGAAPPERAVMRSTTTTTPAGGMVTRFIAESPKCKDAPDEARPPLRSRGRAVLVNRELCLIDQPHAVVFARPSAVQAYPSFDQLPPPRTAAWRRVYADPHATRLAYEAKYGPAR